MNVAMWVLVGAAVGWIGFSLLKFNSKRGGPVSIVGDLAYNRFGI